MAASKANNREIELLGWRVCVCLRCSLMFVDSRIYIWLSNRCETKRKTCMCCVWRTSARGQWKQFSWLCKTTAMMYYTLLGMKFYMMMMMYSHTIWIWSDGGWWLVAAALEMVFFIHSTSCIRFDAKVSVAQLKCLLSFMETPKFRKERRGEHMIRWM